MELSVGCTCRNNLFPANVFGSPRGRSTGQDPLVPSSTGADRSWRNPLKHLEWSSEEQLWLMSFLKVDQTLMLRRGNWSKGILNYLMRGSLSERFLFLSSFIPPDHMADLYITKELPGWPASFKTLSWSKETLCMCESKFWSEGWLIRNKSLLHITYHTFWSCNFPEILSDKDFRPEHIGTFIGFLLAMSV